jgi:hypothetical protein
VLKQSVSISLTIQLRLAARGNNLVGQPIWPIVSPLLKERIEDIANTCARVHPPQIVRTTSRKWFQCTNSSRESLNAKALKPYFLYLQTRNVSFKVLRPSNEGISGGPTHRSKSKNELLIRKIDGKNPD